MAAEVGDFSRFKNPKELMAYLGLVPSEHSSGDRIRRGGITKQATLTLAEYVSRAHGHTVIRPESHNYCSNVTKAYREMFYK